MIVPRLLLVLTVCYAVVSCGWAFHNPMAAMLDDVESFIDERPDSALTVLRLLDSTSLRGPSQRARAALLHQIALDKCYIDITADSVLSPAFWYIKHGSADQRLKTWYYRSVLYRNAGDVDSEMSCLVRGERFIPNANDPLMAGRLYTAKRVLFLHLYDLEDASQNAEKAVAFFREAKDSLRYYNAAIGLANIYNLQERFTESGRLLDTLKAHRSEFTARQRNQFRGVELRYISETGVTQEILPFVNDYLKDTPTSQVDWLLVARAYLMCGQLDRVGMALEKVDTTVLDNDHELILLKIKSDFSLASGNEEEALLYYTQFRKHMDRQVELGLSSRARFVVDEEKYRNAKIIRGKWIVVLVILSAVLSCIVHIIRRNSRKHLKTTELLHGQLENKTHQINTLKQQVRASKKEVMQWKEFQQKEQTPPEIKELVTGRIAALNRYAFRRISDRDSKQALIELEKEISHENPELYFRDMTLQYGYLHPTLTQYLDKYRLTEQERVCCTLLAMGYSVKEVSFLMGLSTQRCYNIFNTVRRKLGLEKGSLHLQKILLRKVD